VPASKENGITLVALIITIIVMLILVGVSVQVVINSDLIGTAQDAADRTETQYLEESKAGSLIEIDGTKYLSMEDYMAGIERAPDIMEGEGTEVNPYTIDSIEALVQFAHSVTNGKTYEGEYVKLTRNLDFKSADSYLNANRTDYAEYGYTGNLMTVLTTGEGWQPIGTMVRDDNADKHSFAGIFDGNGKYITNLFICKNIENMDKDMQCGLFAQNYGTIKNLGIMDSDVNFTSTSDTGKGMSIGIIVGNNYKEVNGCFTTGTLYIEIDNKTTIWGGGITGTIKSTGDVTNCYNRTNIEISENGGTAYYIAGIAGATSDTASISNSYNNGSIAVNAEGQGADWLVGGITGYLHKNTENLIEDCYNVGDLNISGTVKTVYLGGIIGQNRKTVRKCYNIGNVASNVTLTGTYNSVGGIAGLNSGGGGAIENSSYLSSTATTGVGRDVGTTSGLTSVDSLLNMPTVISVVGSAFKADTNNINGGYPILNWQ